MSSKQQYRNPPPSPLQQAAPPSYSQGPPPYKPPPSDTGISATSLIVIVVIMIIISVFIFVVIYLTAGMCSRHAAEPNINIRDGESTGTAGSWKLMVGSVSSGEDLANYQVAVKRGNTIVISVTDLDAVKAGGATGSGLYLNFSDATNDNKLNKGDWFTLEYTDSTSDYQIIIYWKSSGNGVSGDTGKIEQ